MPILYRIGLSMGVSGDNSRQARYTAARVEGGGADIIQRCFNEKTGDWMPLIRRAVVGVAFDATIVLQRNLTEILKEMAVNPLW